MKRARKGFSLIEVMVAMTILSIVLLNLAHVMTAIAVRGRGSDVLAKRTAVLQLEANKFGAVRYADLATWSTTAQSFTWGNFTYERRLTITPQGATRYTIKIVVVPQADPTKADSIMLDRTLPPTSSPLCKGC